MAGEFWLKRKKKKKKEEEGGGDTSFMHVTLGVWRWAEDEINIYASDFL